MEKRYGQYHQGSLLLDIRGKPKERQAGSHLAEGSGGKNETTKKKVGISSIGRRKTDRDGEPSLLPYTPKDVTNSKEVVFKIPEVGQKANHLLLLKDLITETETRDNSNAETRVRPIQNPGRRTDVSQTITGADSLSGKILGPKTTLQLGCWNVRTLYQTGRLAQVVREMENDNINLLAVSEERWTGSGIRQLASKHHIAFSERQDNYHDRDVALIMTNDIRKSLIEWKPINERLLTARFYSTYAKLSVIACCAPTEVAEEEDKNIFYEKLQELIETTPRHDILVVLGDLNAKVGNENIGKEATMGMHGIGERNNNGERLVELCEENSLVIGGTIFKHRDIHKQTWTSPDDHTNNQIDHIIINRRRRGSLQDVRVKRGADIGSDHSLVIAKIKLKLRKVRKKTERKLRLDVDKLKEPSIQRNFQMELRNKLSVLNDEQEMSIHDFNKTVYEVGDKILGPKRKNQKNGFLRTPGKL
ncbi:craniofacial development protein 2-like [Ostrea edulis]|uniref:craniofacial development protein 2-like n=1 Tax=Ostrea edulis TaxID=37623 RepID=UPI0024AF66F0|nr:craniofacial development protein 2-like [Ostrea edulis]